MVLQQAQRRIPGTFVGRRWAGASAGGMMPFELLLKVDLPQSIVCEWVYRCAEGLFCVCTLCVYVVCVCIRCVCVLRGVYVILL